MTENGQTQPPLKTGWVSRITMFALVALLFESVTGLVITLAPFSVFVQWSVLAHSAAGLLLLAPFIWYLWVHWLDYRDKALSDVTLLGYLSLAGLSRTSARLKHGFCDACFSDQYPIPMESDEAPPQLALFRTVGEDSD